MEKKKKLTTAAGAPVPGNSTAVAAGPRGPVLWQDVRCISTCEHTYDGIMGEFPEQATMGR